MPNSKSAVKPLGKLGINVAKYVSEIKADAEQLQAVVGKENAPLIDNLYGLIDDWRFSLAAVGQMKAGKSSFLNAVIHDPNLLPSDVNPWTTVVTKLRFGHPEEQTSGGRFNFFDEEDWTKIIERSHEGAEHLKDLVVDFDQSVLSKQFKDMRARAQKRLGNLYPLLLGNSHNYDMITQNILERYVAAGVDTDGKKTGSNARAGYYADITKYAEIFFPKDLFEIPTVVIDTPGVNDPFLVRDEFTCQVLGDADVYLMFMSIHQPLTAFDLNFIEILARQNNKRIIIVLNRVDELENYATNAAICLKDVEQRLNDAGYGDQIQAVVAGSALWGQAARSGEKLDSKLPYDDMGKMVKALYNVTPKDQRECLEYASGLHSVETALEDSLNSTSGAKHVSQIVSNLQYSLEKTKVLIEAELRENQALVGETDKKLVRDSYVKLLEKKLKSAQAKKIRFQKSVNAANQIIEKDFGDILAESRREYITSLNDVIKQEAEKLSAQVNRQTKDPEISVDTVSIRNAIFEFSASFHDSKLKRVDNNFQTAKKSLEEHIDGNVDATVDTNTFLFSPVLPDVQQDLKIPANDQSKLLFWKKNKVSPKEFNEKLNRLLNGEMSSTIAVIQNYTTENLVNRNFEYKQASHNFITSEMALLDKNISALESSLAAANDPKITDADIPKSIKSRVTVLEAQIKKIDSIASKYN